jgi:hypothetical protein
MRMPHRDDRRKLPGCAADIRERLVSGKVEFSENAVKLAMEMPLIASMNCSSRAGSA